MSETSVRVVWRGKENKKYETEHCTANEGVETVRPWYESGWVKNNVVEVNAVHIIPCDTDQSTGCEHNKTVRELEGGRRYVRVVTSA